MEKCELNYREVLAQRLRVPAPRIVLDAGTGAGVMTKALSKSLDSFIVSIDINKQVFPRVLEKVNRNRVGFVACDFAHLPFKEEIFGAVVCDLVTSTSEEWKPSPIYTEFKRTLKTKSSLFILDYYPEKSSKTKEARLAASTSRLYRTVMKAKGAQVHQSVPPESSIRQLRKIGFTKIRKQRIRANEQQEWKRRVLEEYYGGMKAVISDLSDLKLKTRLLKELNELKKEIESGGRITWGWGVNYLVEATK